MGDVDDRQLHLFLDVLNQFQDLGLNGHVQRRGRLVADQHVWIGRQGDGDDHALPHAAGQLMRIVLHALFSVGNAHQLQQLQRPVMRLLFAHAAVQDHTFHHLFADLHGRVQAGHGVLKHHGDVLAVDGLAQLLAGQFQQINGMRSAVPVGIGIDDFAVIDRGVAVQQAHCGLHGDGFARAGFAHDGHRFAAAQFKIDPADGVHAAGVGAEGDIQIADLKNGFAHAAPPYISSSLGASASRSPSPIKLKPSISSASTRMGGRI